MYDSVHSWENLWVSAEEQHAQVQGNKWENLWVSAEEQRAQVWGNKWENLWVSAEEQCAQVWGNKWENLWVSAEEQCAQVQGNNWRTWGFQLRNASKQIQNRDLRQMQSQEWQNNERKWIGFHEHHTSEYFEYLLIWFEIKPPLPVLENKPQNQMHILFKFFGSQSLTE